jgi:hypothetical protein
VLQQLPSRLIGPSDIFKKLSHHFLLRFSIGMGSYDHTKYQGMFPYFLANTFFHKGPPFGLKKI